MANAFFSPDGDLESIFVNDYAMIDQYAKTGSLWLWGYNFAGDLGDNTITYKSSPVQTIAGGTNWKQVACGAFNAVGPAAAIKTDGTLWTWGSNSIGQLGDNTIVNKSSPIQTVAGGSNWKQVAIKSTVAAIKTDGTLWLWGDNTYGQLGDNTVVPKSSPIQTIAGGTNWNQVAIGGDHTAAIKTDGTLWIWGRNNNGQLGDNTVVSKSSPIQTVAGGNNWKQVSCGMQIAGAIKTDGTLWVWGYNTFSILGDSTGVSKSSPVQTFAGGTNWKQVACGDSHFAAIKTDGTLWTWGTNTDGQLGINTSTDKSRPTQTVSAGTNWKQVSCGYSHTGSIKTDGTLWIWGSNSNGQLGDNTIISKSSPIQTVAGGTSWKNVACGGVHTSAIYFYDAGNLYPSA